MAQKRKAHSAKDTKTQQPDKDDIDIPEDEQWRLINDSGILNKIPTSKEKQKEEEEEEPIELAEEIFNAVLLIIPFTFCLILMTILIHFQYRQHPTFNDIMDRLLSGFPILSLFIFYTTRYKAHRIMQFLLLVIGVLCGSRLVYLINLGSWLTNMQQCPPLATLWIYSAVQLDLGPSVLNLVLVGVYTWLKGLKIFP